VLNLLALGDGAQRNSAVTSGSSDYSCVVRIRLKSAPGGGDYRTIFTFFNSPGYTQWAGIFSDANTNDLRLSVDDGGGDVFTTTFTPTTNVYCVLTYIRSGTTHSFYANGTLVGSVIKDVSGTSFNTIRIGHDGFSNDTDMEAQHFKEWSVALTGPERIIEEGNLAPVKTASLVSYITLSTDYTDSSGNGNNWSATGAPTFSTSIPSNTVAGTALFISSLPASISRTVHFSGTTYEVWYKYTAITGDKVVGVFGFGDLVTYKPRTRAYSDAGVTQIVDTGTSFQNRPIQFPVTVSTTYFLRFTSNAGNPTPAVLTLEVEKKSTVPIPVGSIAVNDDTEGFPLVLLSSTNGDDYNVLNFINSGFPAGEAADVLKNGISLWADAWNGVLKLFDTSFSLLATVALNVGFDIPIRTNNGNDLFYVGIPGSPVTVKTVDDTGAIGGTTYTLTGNTSIAGLASNLAGTILYFANEVASAPVKRWNLSTDTALSDLVAAQGTYRISDILVLDDDSIVVLYYNTVFGNFIIRRYDSTGATLNTYATTSDRFPAGTFPRLAYAIDNPNSFWVMFHPNPVGTARFENWKVSNGSILSSVDQIEYETGVYNHAETATPIARFGVSFSCPFIIVQSNVGILTGSITVGKVTDPFDGATTFNFTAGGGLTPTSFNLKSEEEREFNHIPAGNGYSIEETGPSGFKVTYLVSNGSLITNIEVGEDEEVTVTVLNELRATKSGLYQFTPNRTKDTYIDGDGAEEDLKIPDPFIECGFLVDK